ncbi:MAG: hypothetical protein IKS96_02740 [Fibrobacter sp.]|nr:hypothetical protein [Bacteroidaceae bacterium]MBR6448860.1 hypothetical protein [Fibrobacter sp.]
MKYFINLTAEDAQRLRRILHDLRQSLTVVESSMSWRNVGSPAPEYSLDDIVFIEDLRALLAAQVDEDETETHFAGFCRVY